MQYRSTLSAILTLFKNLTFTDSHKSCIRRTPFGELLMPFIEDEKITHNSLKKSDYGINKILITYNRPERAFVLGGKRMTITQTECKLILGIKSGRRRMTIVENKYGSSNSTHGLAVRRFQGIKTLRLGHLRDRIQELMPSDAPTDIEDVIRMIVLHLMTTVFFTSSGDCVKWAYLQYVEDFHRMNQYNWAKEIVDNLMKSIHDNGAATAKGCTPIVLVSNIFFITTLFSFHKSIDILFVKRQLKLLCAKSSIGIMYQNIYCNCLIIECNFLYFLPIDQVTFC